MLVDKRKFYKPCDLRNCGCNRARTFLRLIDHNKIVTVLLDTRYTIVVRSLIKLMKMRESGNDSHQACGL